MFDEPAARRQRPATAGWQAEALRRLDRLGRPDLSDAVRTASRDTLARHLAALEELAASGLADREPLYHPPTLAPATEYRTPMQVPATTAPAAGFGSADAPTDLATEDEVCLASIVETGAAYRRRQLSPVEVAKAVLARIERRNPTLNAFITVTAELALAAARRAEQELMAGHDRGLLHGIPISLKDVIATAGVRTTAGSRILADWVPEADASVVERLTAAGAVVVGKTSLHEFAFGVTSVNPHYGPARNPWSDDRIPGGSSGGSAAAVAAGLGHASVGSDTGGSIRRPAGFCGVVGLKPTFGLVSRRGVVPGPWSLDHVGPLTRTVRDAALVLGALAGHDPRDPLSSKMPMPDLLASLDVPLRGLRLGLPVRFAEEGLTDEALTAYWRTVDLLTHAGMAPVEVALHELQYAGIVLSTISLSEVSSLHRHWYPARAHEYGVDSQMLLEHAACVSAAEYLMAQRARRGISDAMLGALSEVDAILAPTTLGPAPRIEDGVGALGDRPWDVSWHYHGLNRACNLAGLPAVTVPCGQTADGLPLAIQVIGRPFDEASVLQVASTIERHRPRQGMAHSAC